MTTEERRLIAGLRQHYRTIKEAMDNVALLLGEPNLGSVMAVFQQRNAELLEENRVLKTQLMLMQQEKDNVQPNLKT